MTTINHLSDFTQICRVCLVKNSNLIPLATNIEDKNSGNYIPIKYLIGLISTTPVGTDDESFPANICENCKSLLESAYIFKLKYEQSSEILQACVATRKSMQDKILYSVDEEDDQNLETILEGSEDVVETKDDDEDEDIVPCPICTVELPALQLRKHAHSHKALRSYLQIPKAGPNVLFYAMPRKTISMFNTVEIKHKCPVCSLYFVASDFRMHVRNHCKLDEFTCEKCDRSFRKIRDLNIHKKIHLQEFPFKCPECDKGFMIEKNYECHLLTHRNIELPHVCNVCNKGFSNPGHLHRHQVIHTENVSYSSKYKIFRCGQCLKSFKEKDLLQDHECKPIKKGEYKCKICNNMYTNPSNLYHHVRHKHEKKQKIKCLCSVCGNHVTHLAAHMQRHTGEKPYKCPDCLKRFSSNAVLRKHQLVHSGLKPFVCSVCGKAFNNMYNLQVHERIHIGNRTHVCNVCGKGFLEKSYLRKHLKIHSFQ